MFLLLLIFVFCPARYECETVAGNETLSKGKNDSLPTSALLLPKQEALTFLRPTVVRSPTQITNPFARDGDRPLPRRRISSRERMNRPEIPRVFSSQTKIPRGQFSKKGFLESRGRKRMPSLMGRKSGPPPIPLRKTYPRPPPGILKQRASLRERPRYPPIDRMDPGGQGLDPRYWDYLQSEGVMEHPLTHSGSDSNLNFNRRLSLDQKGSLEAALKVLWSNRKSAYESILASSLVEGQTLPRIFNRHMTSWAVWESSEEGEHQEHLALNQDQYNPLNPEAPLNARDSVDAWQTTYSSGSHPMTHENEESSMDYGLSKTPTFNNDPFFHERRRGVFSLPERRFEATRNYGGSGDSRKFFSGDERGTLSGRVLPKDRSFWRNGRRIPRKQLVKRSDRHLSDDIVEEKPNDYTELTLDRVDENGGLAADEDYTLYIDNEAQDVVRERGDRMDLDNDLYFLEDQDYGQDIVGFEEDVGGGEGEEAYIDVFGLEDEYVEVEYIDEDYVYVDTQQDEDDGSSLYAARMGSLNDTVKLNRQGLLHLGSLSPDREPLVNRRQRPHPRRPSGSPRPRRPSDLTLQLPPRTVSKPLKRIRVRIKNKTDSGTKRIRMKIKGIPGAGPVRKPPPGKLLNQLGSSSSVNNYHKSRKVVNVPNYRPFRQLKNKRRRPSRYPGIMNPGYDRINRPGYGDKKTPGYERTKASESGSLKRPGHRREKRPNYPTLRPDTGGVKGSLGWANLRQMSNSLPDLNKAITVMSFVAFSVFVANLGINAIANTTSGLSFGRSSPWSDWFLDKPGLTLDGLIEELDRLFETPDTNHTRNHLSTFNAIAALVQDVYNELSDVTRDEIENASKKVNNFLGRDFSKDDLPLGDISKGFMSRQLDKEHPYGQLKDTCYRKLLCLAHNLTRKSGSKDIRNKLIPFWTFGIGWLKNDESAMPVLLENLRAELAGQSGRDCRELFSSCSNNTLVESLLSEVKDELLSDTPSVSREEVFQKIPANNSLPKNGMFKRESVSLNRSTFPLDKDKVMAVLSKKGVEPIDIKGPD